MTFLPPSMESNSKHSRRLLGATPFLFVLLACGLLVVSLNNKHDGPHHAAVNSDGRRRHGRKLGQDCEATCAKAGFKDLEYFNGDNLLNPETMLERVKKQRQKWVNDQLKKDYGPDNYLNMFEPEETFFNNETQKTTKQRVNAGRKRIFKDPSTIPQTKNPDQEELPADGPGWDRMTRKLQMKILQIQLGILEERKNAKPICLDECAKVDDEEGSRFLGAQASGGLYTKYTWVTGGHSASAGHGNLFRESYTAYMDRALTPILSTIGLDFEARNYAMGGTDSAEEVSLCFNSVFGRDVDSISWDYGMTDGHDLWKVIMYAYKAAGLSRAKGSRSQPGNVAYRPAFFPIHQQGGVTMVAKEMQDLGMTSLAYNGQFMQETVLAAVPDMFGKGEQEIAKTPPYVQYLKCEDKIESGDPGCGENKFNNSLCTGRAARTSWHPGWKAHALTGNMMAMTMLELFEDALKGLIEMEMDSTGDDIEATKQQIADKLKEFDDIERRDYERIFTEPIPEELKLHIEKFWGDDAEGHLKDMDVESFYKEPSFCHTALLPSEIRYKGLLTENFTNVGSVLDQTLDEGIPWGEVQGIEAPPPRSNQVAEPYKDPRFNNATDKLKLIMTNDGKDRQTCEEQLNVDHKDWFHVGSVADWQNIVLPNDSEKKYYNEWDAKKSKGLILICLSRCSWGKCPGGDLHNYLGWKRPSKDPPTEEQVKNAGHLEMFINEQKVTEASDMHNCYALRNRDGHVWKPNDKGQYEIKMKVGGRKDDGLGYFKISGFIFI